MRAVAAVAHPDDCVIFAKPFIDNHPEYEWSIVYLTYRCTNPRAQEMRRYWDKRQIHTHFLGFKDDYIDQQTQQLNHWYGIDAEADMFMACRDADLILTHNEDGDYGHIHHKLVNSAFTHVTDKIKVYFASTFNYNKEYIARSDLDLDEFPLHREVIEGFTTRNRGLYIEPK